MELIKVTEEYYNFIREMRMHPDNTAGFLESADITEDQQKAYMDKHKDGYFIALVDNKPAGYVGVVDNDIRVCTSPEFKKMGVGSFMLSKIVFMFPEAKAKILEDNIASQKLFDKCEVPYRLIND